MPIPHAPPGLPPSEIPPDDTDDDGPLLASDEKPRAWNFAPIHKDDNELTY